MAEKSGIRQREPSGKRPEVVYKFNQQELQSLVQKRKSYINFERALNFMKKAQNIIKRRQTEVNNSKSERDKITDTTRDLSEHKKVISSKEIARVFTHVSDLNEEIIEKSQNQLGDNNAHVKNVLPQPIKKNEKLRRKNKKKSKVQNLDILKNSSINQVLNILLKSKSKFKICVDALRLRCLILGYCLSGWDQQEKQRTATVVLKN